MRQVTKDFQKSGIYCIQNISNNKRYIGSSKNIYGRLLKHFALLRHAKHENIILQNSWLKHGEEEFDWFVLEYCEEEFLTEREQYYIDLFKAEYNITRKVERNILSPESRKKQSQTRRRLIAEGKLAVNFNPKKTYQYDLMGNFLREYDSLEQASLETGVSESSICRNLNGTYQAGGGFMWAHEYKETLPPYQGNSKRLRKLLKNCRFIE
ncbi:homing endonuclease [uncultured phage cr111_1]|uniref:Endonuclease n=1 Tax=uncultured phage cr111_1 TaxID=2772071 RepID=A0A7M1RY25_9CAUD|nr:homing endonuclease [uncultured phage cr111_1]QOR59186.1 endonuclease [uncultured phage cr111_1]